MVRGGLLIGLVISFLFGAAYVFFIDDLLTSLTLEAEVAQLRATVQMLCESLGVEPPAIQAAPTE